MTQDVYADLLFLINFSMDYLCLFISTKILHRVVHIIRLAAASALGGVYSVISLFIEAASPWPLILDVAVCFIMCIIVFYSKDNKFSSVFLCTGLFFGISMLTGGVMTALFNLLNRADLPIESIGDDSVSVWLFAALAASAGLISLVGSKFVSKRYGIRSCTVKILFDGKEKEFRGMVDSGNLVSDPVSGKNVIIIDREKAKNLVDTDIIDAFTKGLYRPQKSYLGMRLLPVTTASGKSFLVAIKAQKIILTLPPDKKGRSGEYITDSLFAVSDIGRSACDYDAIVPDEIIKSI